MKPFWGGLPGAMLGHSTSLTSCQARMVREVNSVPLSLTTMDGVPRISVILSSGQHGCWRVSSPPPPPGFSG